MAIIKYNLPLFDRFDKLLQHAGFHLAITQSSLAELETLKEGISDREKKALMEEAIQWAKRNCERILRSKDLPSGSESSTDAKEEEESHLSAAGRDIRRWVTASIGIDTAKGTKSGHAEPLHKYFVASQDEELLDFIRGTGCVPVIRLARGSVLLLEQPSKVASSQASQKERQKWTASKSVSEPERKLVETARKEEKKRRQEEEQRTAAPIMRRKRKAKGPNPLSCKKKKESGEEVSGGTKRTRRRKKSSSENTAAVNNAV